MDRCQLVSPILQSVRRRWQTNGVFGGTRVDSDLATVVDMRGHTVTWPALLDELLAAPAVPVHAAVETFETARCGRGARASADVAAATFLGLYAGRVCTRGEGLLLSGPVPGPRRGRRPDAGQLLAREERTARLHSHCVEVGRASFAPGTEDAIVALAVDASGYVGNALGRINDGRADPFAEGRGDVEAGGLLRREDRPANCAFAQIACKGWLYLGVVATAAVRAGDEFLLDYSDAYWEQQREFRRDIVRLSQIVAREDDDRAPRARSRCADWVRDSAFLWALWWRRSREDARARRAVRGAERREELRLAT